MSIFRIQYDYHSHKTYPYNIVNGIFTPLSNLEFKLGIQHYMFVKENIIYVNNAKKRNRSFFDIDSIQITHNLGNMEDWKVSNVTDMSNLMFAIHNDMLLKGASEFNEDISKWDVSNVTNMGGMFSGCKTFNQPLNNWDTSKVTTMEGMFKGCSMFNQPLDKWDVSNVTSMEIMFYGCTDFNQPLDMWDVSNVTNMRMMFGDCTNFNQPLNKWGPKLSKVTNMSGMFSRCTNFDQPLDKWDVSKDTEVREIFNNSGMSDENINTLRIKSPYVIITSENLVDGPNGNECPICGESETDNPRCKTPCCGKVFHCECLSGWINNPINPEHRCPNCRKVIPLPSTTGRGKRKTKRSLKKSRKTRKHRKSKKN